MGLPPGQRHLDLNVSHVLHAPNLKRACSCDHLIQVGVAHEFVFFNQNFRGLGRIPKRKSVGGRVFDHGAQSPYGLIRVFGKTQAVFQQFSRPLDPVISTSSPRWPRCGNAEIRSSTLALGHRLLKLINRHRGLGQAAELIRGTTGALRTWRMWGSGKREGRCRLGIKRDNVVGDERPAFVVEPQGTSALAAAP